MQSLEYGLNEKSILAETPDHYTAIHPTQKPTRLLERLMALVTKEGDLVVDPFSGSGSTAIAAYNTRRHFIGFEIDDEYYQASMERLKKETQQTKLAI
jgi:site-specific DNA-methyltransferase (adenine-specific)